MNPYDAQGTKAAQQSEGFDQETVLLRSPPWTLFFLSPFLELPFEYAAKLWLLANLLMLVLSIGLLSSVYSLSRRGFIASSLGTAFFYPVWENILWGQLSILLLLLLSGFLWLCKNSRFFLAGLLSTTLSIKAHLLIVAAPILLIFLLLRRENIRSMITGIAAGVLVLLATCLFFAPGTLEYWLGSLLSSSKEFGVTPVTEWRTASLIGFTRGVLQTSGENAPLWPIWYMPALGVLLAMVVFQRPLAAYHWETILPPALALSLSFAPYGWLYDQSVLIILQTCIIAQVYSLETSALLRRITLAVLALIQVFAVVLSFQESSNQSSYFWIAPAMLGVWFFSRQKTSNAQ